MESLDVRKLLYDGLTRISPITLDMLDDFMELTTQTTYRKGDILVRAGDKPKHLAYNLNGLFRLYYTDDNGNDLTKGFCVPGIFAVSYSAMVEERESYFSIEALTDCQVLIIQYLKWIELANRDVRWFKFLFELVTKVYVMKELREKSFLLDDATTRYNEFIDKYASVVDEIRQYHIASYLGITPETLSRIKKNN